MTGGSRKGELTEHMDFIFEHSLQIGLVCFFTISVIFFFQFYKNRLKKGVSLTMKATLIGKRYYKYDGSAQYAPSEKLYLYFSRLPTIADKGETKGEITCQFSINMAQSSAARDLAQRFIAMDPGTRVILETLQVGQSEQITDFTELD